MNAFPRDSSDEDSTSENDFLHPSTNPGADEFADYNPRKRRRTGRDAKESAALGIFGSESEDDGPGKRWKKKPLKRGGMTFVSAGNKKDGDDEDEDEDEDDEEMEEAEERPAGHGLGFGATSARGLGFNSTAPGKTKQGLGGKGMAFVSSGKQKVGDDETENPGEDNDEVEESEERPTGGLGFRAGGTRELGFNSPAPGKKKNGPGSQYGTPLGKGFVPSSAAVPVLINDDDESTESPRIARPSAFTPQNGRRAGGGGTPINAGSFAARMMAQMGYKEGQGLGKEGQGRSSIIEVQLRPQGVGLGAVTEKSKQEKEEEKRQANLRGEKYEDSDEERKKRKKKPKTSGTDSGVSTPRKAPKPKFRTVEEVQRAAPGLQIPEAFAPILDMTGPGHRLLTSTSGLLTPTAAGAETVEQTENKKLARQAQNDLSAFVEEWKNLEERKAYVEMEIVQQQQEVEEYQREFSQIKSFAETVEGISQAAKDGQWDPVIQALTAADGLEISGVNEELASIAVAAVHPFLRQATEGWQPLDDPKLNGMAPALFNIRHIIGATTNSKTIKSKDSLLNGSRRVKSTTPYESMIYKIVFPKIVSAINQSWDVHNPAPLQTLLDTWDGLLPAFVKSQILDQAVVGKLNEAVSSWNPRKKRHHELPHLWLFPWLQYLSTHHADPKSSTGLVSDIKRKFRHLIDSWDFHKGVIPGLKQWREVLAPSSSNDHWTPLIMNHVLPNMAKFLKNEKNFMVDPNDQSPYMSSLQGIFAWQDILKPHVIGEVIVETIFPMWQSVLHQWLTVVGPNEEIGQWFEWWRDEVFPSEIKSLKSIQQEFEKGHQMINQALDLGSKASTHLPAPAKPIHRTTKSSPPPAPLTPAKAAPVEEASFRHQVEDWCIENDLQFLPEKKVLHSQGPLYRITAAGNGKLGTLVYFKGDSLWAVQRRGQEQVDVGIDWKSADARDALLGMAWLNVK